MHIRIAAALLYAGACALTAGRLEFRTTKPEILRERLEAIVRSDAGRGELIATQLERSGCPQLERMKAPGWRTPNVICTFLDSSPGLVIVGAHNDHAHRRRGAVDNWTGAALSPALLENFKSSPRRYTHMVVAFAAGERGLHGSRALPKLADKDRWPSVQVVVNGDSTGITPSVDTYKLPAASLVYMDSHFGRNAAPQVAGSK